MKRRLVALFTIFCILISTSSSVSATITQTKSSALNSSNNSLSSILDNYHTACFNINQNATKTNSSNISNELTAIKNTTINQIQALGYEVYDLNANTYYSVENSLKTDLSELGLDTNGSYIIVVSGNSDNEVLSTTSDAEFGTPRTPFSYTYNGNTYTMRYLTVTAADSPAYAQTDTVNLLQTNSLNLIENCLNTILYAYLDAVSPISFGTLASICGLSIVDFSSSGTSTLALQAGSSWTRIFTQVWSPYYEWWASGSCVEKVTMVSQITGLYYDASLNQHVSIPNNTCSRTQRSENYLEFDWRKIYAILGYQQSIRYFDLTGDIEYTYNNRVVLTHRENFIP